MHWNHIFYMLLPSWSLRPVLYNFFLYCVVLLLLLVLLFPICCCYCCFCSKLYLNLEHCKVNPYTDMCICFKTIHKYSFIYNYIHICVHIRTYDYDRTYRLEFVKVGLGKFTITKRAKTYVTARENNFYSVCNFSFFFCFT